MNTAKKKKQNEQCTIPVVGRSAFPNGKKKLPKGKYKYVYSYELPNGDIVHQSFISKYKWSAYHDTEKKAAIAVDKFLIGKGKEPINVLVRNVEADVNGALEKITDSKEVCVCYTCRVKKGIKGEDNFCTLCDHYF